MNERPMFNVALVEPGSSSPAGPAWYFGFEVTDAEGEDRLLCFFIPKDSVEASCKALATFLEDAQTMVKRLQENPSGVLAKGKVVSIDAKSRHVTVEVDDDWSIMCGEPVEMAAQGTVDFAAKAS